MTKVHILFCLLALPLFGCAYIPFQTTSKSSEQKLTHLRRQTEVRERTQEDNQLRKILIDERSHQKKLFTKKFKLPAVLNEESLYAEVLRAYQVRDPDGLKFYSDQLVASFPTSIFCDNAVYLSGQLNLALGMPSESLRDFDRVLQEFPLSNMRSAALLGKGVAFRKMQLYKYAEEVFAEVKKQYPNSPEFYRVDLEEKLLRFEKGS